MSLETNLRNLAIRIATEFRTHRSMITGSANGDLTGLSTTAKGNLVAAINEAAAAGGAQNLDQLTDVVVTTPAAGHILRHNGAGQFVNVLGDTHFQPRDSDLDAIAALGTTSYGRAFLALADQAALMGLVQASSETVAGKVELATNAETITGTDTVRATHPAGVTAAINNLVPAASEAAAGKIEIATQTETNTGTDDVRAVTPLKLAGRLGNYQPLDSDLTAIAALTTTTYGRAFLALADQAALMALVRVASSTVTGIVQLATNAEAQTGTDTAKAVTPAALAAAISGKANTASLAAVALSGNAADLTGTLPTSVLPPLAINETYVVVSQAAMLALTAQRGDMAVRTDNGRTYVLTVDGGAATLANWQEIMAAGQVQSVAGKTGVVTLAKADVGLGNVDNTSDANKPISTATQTALDGKQAADAELAALASLASAADRLPYFTGSGTASLATFTAFGRSLVDDADATAARSTLGLGTAATQASTAFQAADADLTAIAALTSAADQVPYATGVGTWAMMTVTGAARGLLDDATVGDMRTTLDVYSKGEIGNPEADLVAEFNTALSA